MTRIKWVRVEWQPNLHKAETTVPLGIIAEQLSPTERKIVLTGRDTKAFEAQLKAEGVWGPFKEVVTRCFEIMEAEIKDLVKTTSPQEYIIDKLVNLWRWNIYFKAPIYDEKIEVTLHEHALREYNNYVAKEPVVTTEVELVFTLTPEEIQTWEDEGGQVS